MQNRGKRFLGCALEWVRRPFDNQVPSNLATSNLPAAQSPDEPPTPGCLDTLFVKNLQADIHASSTETTSSPELCTKAPGRLPPMEMTHRTVNTGEDEIQNQTDIEAGGHASRLKKPQHTAGPDRIIEVNDGGKKCMAFLLAAETISKLQKALEKLKEVRRLAHEYQQADHAANVGQGWLDYLPVMLEGVTSVKAYDQLNRELERRKPDILKDIEHKEQLERELRSKTRDLQQSKDLVDDAFERMLLGHNTINSKCGERNNGPESSSNEERNNGQDQLSVQPAPEMVDKTAQGEISSAEESEDLDILEELELSRQSLVELQFAFDHQRELHEQKEAEFRQKEQRGETDFPKSELDLFNVQQRADATRALIEAEQAHREVRHMARDLGVLQNEPGQESDFVDCTRDGLSSCCGPDEEAPESNGDKTPSVGTRDR